jgi:hypothetical protein
MSYSILLNLVTFQLIYILVFCFSLIILTYYHNEIHLCYCCYSPLLISLCCSIFKEKLGTSQHSYSCLIRWLWLLGILCWFRVHPMPNWDWIWLMRIAWWIRSSTQQWISLSQPVDSRIFSQLRTSCFSNPKHCQLKRLWGIMLLQCQCWGIFMR